MKLHGNIKALQLRTESTNSKATQWFVGLRPSYEQATWLFLHLFLASLEIRQGQNRLLRAASYRLAKALTGITRRFSMNWASGYAYEASEMWHHRYQTKPRTVPCSFWPLLLIRVHFMLWEFHRIRCFKIGKLLGILQMPKYLMTQYCCSRISGSSAS